MLYTDNAYYTIRYSAPLSMVEIVWHEFVCSDRLQQGLTDALVIIKAERAQFLLADASKMNSFKNDDQIWIKDHFLPELHQLEVFKFARITDPNVFTLAVIGSMIEYIQAGMQFSFQMQSFHDRDIALNWLFQDVLV